MDISPLKRLAAMSEKETRKIIGLMSGTSLDGLDIALCAFEGSGAETKVKLLEFETISYDEEFRDDLRSISSKQIVDLQKVTLLNAKIATMHAKMILNCLTKWKVNSSEIDCIASHGQTIYHAPKRLHGLENYPNATLQIGDGDHIAMETGIITLSDFRQKNIAAGAEGAPLALYGDYIMFSSKNENRILLNIGGIANFTFIPASNNTKSKIVCSDVGPGNTLSDTLSKTLFNVSFDQDGERARSGEVNQELLDHLLSHEFFKQALPKTTGPELFNFQFIQDSISAVQVENIKPLDLCATIAMVTVRGIVESIKSLGLDEPFTIYASGGGCHNTFIMEKIQEMLPDVAIKRTEELGINPDAKEAVLFAVLANETLCGSKVDTGYGPAVTMGKISLPN